jgi:molybdopterin synthase catalytic subunit
MTQYAGRLHRHHHAKHEIRIIDHVDHEVPVLPADVRKARAGVREAGLSRRVAIIHSRGRSLTEEATVLARAAREPCKRRDVLRLWL